MTTKENRITNQKYQNSTFVDLLSKDGSDFKSIITRPTILEGLNCNIKDVRLYLSKHLPRLLKIALRNDTTLPTLSAMKLLTSKNASHIPNLVKTSCFSDFTTEFLSKDNLPPMLVGRLSEIALNLFRSGNYEFFTHAGFVILFLKYIDNCSVCDFFVSLFEIDDQLKPAQDWLQEIGFYTEISSLLQKLLSESNNSDNYLNYSIEQENKISLLKIINEALKNLRTRSQIIDGPIFSVFQNYYKLPIYVSGFYWKTINLLYDDTTRKHLLIFAKEARNIFINPLDSVHMYCTEALKFLKKYVYSNPELFDSELVKSIITLMMQFENCELFLIEAANLFIIMCNSEVLSPRMVKYASLFVNEAADSKRSSFQMISLSIANDLACNQSTIEFFKKISLPPKFMNKTLKPYINKLNNVYGVPPEENKFNNEQDLIRNINDKNVFWDLVAKFSVP